MPGTPIRIGPWGGGLNLRVNSEDLADNELTECINFDIDDSGQLTSRRPLKRLNLNTILGFTETQNIIYRVIGSYHYSTAYFAIIEVYNAATTKYKYAFISLNSLDPTKNIVLFSTFELTTPVSSFESYAGTWYWSTYLGIYTTPKDSFQATAFSTAVTPTLLGTAQPLRSALLFKDRLFGISGVDRIYYSKATDPGNFTVPNGGFFDVAPQDGEPISKILVQNSQLHIFKATGTWSFTFTADPGTDGNLRIVSEETGAIDAVLHNNEILLINKDSVYRYINTYFQDIAEKINWGMYSFEIASIALVEETLICTGVDYSAAPATSKQVVFACNLTNGAWSQYDFYPEKTVADAVGFAPDFYGTYGVAANYSNVYGEQGTIFSPDIGSSNVGSRMLPYFVWNRNRLTEHSDIGRASADATGTPNKIFPVQSFRTKAFNFGNELEWKRLFWFGTTVLESIVPVIGALTYDRQWGIVTETSQAVTPSTNKTDDRMNNIRSGRFRKVEFKYSAPVLGPSTTITRGRMRIKSLVAYIKSSAPVGS